MTAVLTSMPVKPILGPGQVWNSKKLRLVRGHIVEFGYADTNKTTTMLVTEASLYPNESFGNVRGYEFATQKECDIDSPTQVIRIGPVINARFTSDSDVEFN